MAYSNSNLVSYVDTTNGNWDYRKSKISRITIHIVDDIILNLNRFSATLRSGVECSWNYAISSKGDIGLFVAESNRSWTKGYKNNAKLKDNDDKSINIEVASNVTDESGTVSKETYNALLNLCEDICRRNGFELKYDGTLAGSNLMMHRWFDSSTKCPGDYLASKFSEIKSTVNTRLKGKSNLKYVQDPNIITTAYDAAVMGVDKIDSLLVNSKLLKPYIITTDRNTKTPNYAALKKMGVVGVAIEAGRLYDGIHLKVNYKNPNLDNQIAQAVKANLPYALYTTVCARSVDEAKAELGEFRNVLRKYTPLLGVWLKLSLVKPNSINDSILEQYAKSLESWGWLNRIGIYATKSQISKISWKERWYQSMYLWLDDHLKSLEFLDQLLTPSLFSV